MMINPSNTNNGNLFILPREAGLCIRLPSEGPLGSGPFYMSEYVPSVRFTFKRNPG